MIKVSDYIMKFIADLGVEDVFFLSGGGCMHLVDSLGRNERLNQVANLHEQCSTIAANGYSQYTGKLGVALVTTGPGGTNAITGVAASWIDSNPVLILSGQVKRADLMRNKGVRQMGPQEVDIVKIVESITKYSITVMNPLDIRKTLEEAVHLATTGRKGPVWIDVPLDVQGAYIDECSLEGYNPITEKEELGFNIEKVYELINDSKRPVILLGNGARYDECYKKLISIAEHMNVPILTTWRSMDLIENSHYLYYGRPGAIGQRAANFIQQNSDLFISIGARLDLGQVAFDYKNLARDAKKIIVDIDRYEIEKIDTHIDMPIVSSAKDFIDVIYQNLALKNEYNYSEWIDRCNKYKTDYPVITEDMKISSNNVNTYTLIEHLSEVLNENDVIVPGSSGSCSEVTSQVFSIKKGQRYINSPGLGSMGFGVAESIGVSFASKRRVICLIGDGGLQHNLQELELLKRYNLPIKVLVLNNNAYGSIRQMQMRNFEGRLYGCDNTNDVTLPDLEKITHAYDIKYLKLEKEDQITNVLNEMLSDESPVICEVMIDDQVVTQPRTSSVVLEDGSMSSRPLEDLWPFLDREEFENNMIINRENS